MLPCHDFFGGDILSVTGRCETTSRCKVWCRHLKPLLGGSPEPLLSVLPCGPGLSAALQALQLFTLVLAEDEGLNFICLHSSKLWHSGRSRKWRLETKFGIPVVWTMWQKKTGPLHVYLVAPAEICFKLMQFKLILSGFRHTDFKWRSKLPMPHNGKAGTIYLGSCLFCQHGVGSCSVFSLFYKRAHIQAVTNLIQCGCCLSTFLLLAPILRLPQKPGLTGAVCKEGAVSLNR